MAILAAFAAFAVMGCGDGNDGPGGSGGPGSSGRSNGSDLPDAEPAESPAEFIKQFELFTGVPLKPVKGDVSGIRLELPLKPSRFARFGAYALIWTRDDGRRKALLGRGRPDGDGIYWQPAGTSFTAVKPFGSRLILRWIGRPAKRTTAQWDRLERALEAASQGKASVLEPAERPCDDAGLDPLEGDSGECSVKGIPVTFVDADEELSTPALEARVLGVGTTGKLSSPGLAPLVPDGRFLIVAYRVVNTSPHPIRFLQPQLRSAGKTLPEYPEAAFLLPRSRALPLPPGATLEARTAFDIPSSMDPRAGTFVVPGARNGRDDPSLELHQGLIRLSKAPTRLPKPRGSSQARPPGG